MGGAEFRWQGIDRMAERPCVFIQTNEKQVVGALVAQHALRRHSRHADSFDVRILHTEDFPVLRARDGESYRRDGVNRTWRYDDLQSFTPLRFLPPELMGYAGRALVIDPDIFAVADVWPLLCRDMRGAAILCRKRETLKGLYGHYASSAMLLDCAKLRHWRFEDDFNALFSGERDYAWWMSLRLEPAGSIGLFEPEWNHFDRLTPETKMLHNTRRITQPWKTGLPIDFTPPDAFSHLPGVTWVMRASRHLIGRNKLIGRYWRHPDPRQERLFFGLLQECLREGTVTEDLLRQEMQRNHVRHDAFEILQSTEPLAA
jgi:hypothetical protein